ncbi:hypothetical protein BDZ90DRAFT_280769 [Jaminaea rosea]|uniref:Uncharacterized protein n=1 Tax=Jaminaea rosea TaxID=1569628 RepID=A0A316UPH0_9BASI|nr:hypothetical protein BDZ90DRAFT_280769 [Jaminaea rosea]PWN26241.1 hypothetical protein BDZ90DRAFT_280769 [Jaminaea rosea]
MAGPNLEVFKFGLYLFFPLAIMVHYGDPDWYRKHVLPIRDEFWPRENTLFKPPRNSTDLKSTLEEMKEQRLARRDARLAGEAAGKLGQQQEVTKARTSSSSSSSSSSRPSPVPHTAAPGTSFWTSRGTPADWEKADRRRLV